MPQSLFFHFHFKDMARQRLKGPKKEKQNIKKTAQ